MVVVADGDNNKIMIIIKYANMAIAKPSKFDKVSTDSNILL